MNLEGQEWKNHRTKLTPMFSTGKIKMMFEVLDQIGYQLVASLEENLENQDLRLWAQRFTNDTIGNVAFGLEFGCLQNNDSETLKFGKRLFELKPLEVLRILFGTEFPNLARKLGLRFTNKESGDFFLKTFLETLDYRERNKIDRNDFVTLLLKLKEFYSPVELAAEAFLIYTGGFETSSSLISYVLYELAVNQDIQNKLRKEVIKGIDKNNGKLTYDSLFGCKYLDMVINEALRKYPPLPYIFRKCTRDFTFQDRNLVIPVGTTMVINAYSFHNDPDYFPEPQIFDPERFSDENVKSITPFTFFPFGEGQRNCM